MNPIIVMHFSKKRAEEGQRECRWSCIYILYRDYYLLFLPIVEATCIGCGSIKLLLVTKTCNSVKGGLFLSMFCQTNEVGWYDIVKSVSSVSQRGLYGLQCSV